MTTPPPKPPLVDAEILHCVKHDTWAIAIGGVRLTPVKCCGSWKALKSWEIEDPSAEADRLRHFLRRVATEDWNVQTLKSIAQAGLDGPFSRTLGPNECPTHGMDAGACAALAEEWEARGTVLSRIQGILIDHGATIGIDWSTMPEALEALLKKLEVR